METIWKTCPTFPDYEASSDGDVRLIATGRIVPQCTDNVGYRSLHLNGKTVRAHRVICAAFHGFPPKGKSDVAHADGSRTNNAAANLRWASRAENMADAKRHGTITAQRGSASPNSKLTEDEVRAIRAAPRRRGLLYELAAKYGISRNVVGNIRTKTSPCWPHVR